MTVAWLGEIVKRGPLQSAANGVYRESARLAAKILGTSEIVESIFVHRSVAVGEVAFARSDIDLMVVVRNPVAVDRDTTELLRFYRRLQLLRKLNPALGHVEVHDSDGFQSWFWVDTYRGSMDRRSALLLHGKAMHVPPMPVQPEHAARRFALFPHYFLSPAVRGHNQRNLHKIGLDMWNAQATAVGKIPEPALMRQEMERLCCAAGEDLLGGECRLNVTGSLSFVFHLADRLHDRLLPPLKQLSAPVICTLSLPPTFHNVILVVLPQSSAALPPDAFDPKAVIVTPELLDLYVHYANAFLYAALPQELAQLGIEPPDRGAYLRTCLYEFHSSWVRSPGFMFWHTGGIFARMFAFEHCVRQMESHVVPVPIDGEEARPQAMKRLSPEDYYETHCSRILTKQERLWERLVRLISPAGTEGSSASLP